MWATLDVIHRKHLNWTHPSVEEENLLKIPKIRLLNYFYYFIWTKHISVFIFMVHDQLNKRIHRVINLSFHTFSCWLENEGQNTSIDSFQWEFCLNKHKNKEYDHLLMETLKGNAVIVIVRCWLSDRENRICDVCMEYGFVCCMLWLCSCRSKTSRQWWWLYAQST